MGRDEDARSARKATKRVAKQRLSDLHDADVAQFAVDAAPETTTKRTPKQRLSGFQAISFMAKQRLSDLHDATDRQLETRQFIAIRLRTIDPPFSNCLTASCDAREHERRAHLKALWKRNPPSETSSDEPWKVPITSLTLTPTIAIYTLTLTLTITLPYAKTTMSLLHRHWDSPTSCNLPAKTPLELKVTTKTLTLAPTVTLTLNRTVRKGH